MDPRQQTAEDPRIQDLRRLAGNPTIEVAEEIVEQWDSYYRDASAWRAR
jgi:hypothetical protein